MSEYSIDREQGTWSWFYKEHERYTSLYCVGNTYIFRDIYYISFTISFFLLVFLILLWFTKFFMRRLYLIVCVYYYIFIIVSVSVFELSFTLFVRLISIQKWTEIVRSNLLIRKTIYQHPIHILQTDKNSQHQKQFTVIPARNTHRTRIKMKKKEEIKQMSDLFEKKKETHIAFTRDLFTFYALLSRATRIFMHYHSPSVYQAENAFRNGILYSWPRVTCTYCIWNHRCATVVPYRWHVVQVHKSKNTKDRRRSRSF